MKVTKDDYKSLPKYVKQSVRYLFKRCMPDCACGECIAIGNILKYCLTVRRQPKAKKP